MEKQFDIEDHQQYDLITFIKQLKDEEISSYFTDTIAEQAKTWYDDHGYGIINLIRYSIIDRLVNQRQYPLPTFDTSHEKRWVKQTCESVKAGELSYNRDIEIYYVNDYMKYGEETRTH